MGAAGIELEDGSVSRKGRWARASRFKASEKLSILHDRGTWSKGPDNAVAEAERGFEVDAMRR